MTRINLVPVDELMDQHLMAEYREILMVPAALKRSLRTRSATEILKSIPSEFTLGKGHVTFFYDKMWYLFKRYEELIAELEKRGFKLGTRKGFHDYDIPSVFWNGYAPTEAALEIITSRIEERIRMKPAWYRKTLTFDYD